MAEELNGLYQIFVENYRLYGVIRDDKKYVNFDKFKEVYDGHIGLEFTADGDEYFEDFTNCPFCGAPISYVIRKTFRMVPGKTGGSWIREEI